MPTERRSPRQARSWLLLDDGIGAGEAISGADHLVLDIASVAKMALTESIGVGSPFGALLPRLSSGETEDVTARAVRCGAGMVILPGVQSAADIQRLDVMLRVEEARQNLADGSTEITALLQAAALLQASALQHSNRRLCALALDFFDPVADPRSETTSFARAQLALAAHAAGIMAIDAPSTTENAERFHSECLAARENGFSGKFLLRNEQVEIANEVFRPWA